MKYFKAFCIVALIAQPLAAGAYDPYETVADFMGWFEANQTAQPQFVDGDLITFDQAEMLRPFVPPAYQDEMFFPGMEVQIRDAGDLTPGDIYQAATKKFYGQATVAADGALQNYTAGRPFDPATFTPSSMEDGFKLGWNFNYRWQNEGAETGEAEWVWVRRGGNHAGHEIMNGNRARFYGGEGTFERILRGPYKRIYLTHRADLANQDYKVQGNWAEGVEFREYTGFDSPFDIAGTAFVIIRYEDPRKTDDAWAYIPSLRRVRRISAEVKSDSLLGTDLTLEDFYCFAGRVLEWDWEYLGTVRLLAVARSRNLNTHFYGPDGVVPFDDWSLRLMDVAKMTPKRSNHPYSAKIMMLDRETSGCYYADNYDVAGRLWKVIQLSKSWSENAYNHEDYDFELKPSAETPLGTRMTMFQSINTIDKQNNRATLVPTRGMYYGPNDPIRMKRQFDINSLTKGR